MWNDLVFDTAGNLYVPDDKPRIWRVSPDGTATIWVTDPRLAGLFGFAGGPLGGRIDPSGQWLYTSITVAADEPWTSAIYRIRLVDQPTAADIELVHRFPFDPSQVAPQATGLAFAASGNLYVSLIGPNQIAVLDPSGDEIARISDPRFYSPGAWRSRARRCSLRTATSNPVTTRTPGRSSGFTSTRPGCRSTVRRPSATERLLLHRGHRGTSAAVAPATRRAGSASRRGRSG